MLARGLDAFRAGLYFAAHEEWEAVWLRAEGSRKRHLQGLIQVAAGGVHLAAGRVRPAATLLALALPKLADAPNRLDGLPAGEIRARALEVAEALAAGERPHPSRLFSGLPAR